MSLKEEVDLLRRIPLFANIEASKLKLLAFTSERVAFEGGQVLFRQGDMGDAAYIIIEGEAEVLVDGPAGPVTVAVLGRDAFVGEIAILCDVPRTATVRARQRLVCLRIAKELFLRLINEFPQMAVAVMRELALRLEASNQKLRAAVAEIEALRRPAQRA
ncbi:MAG TPA: cyclic nucleotide-binding domain-containing protein [Stellaceae bacterium]|nr:cyclic nucleotide-binding domain-containing protein [Stellaceae bacterium]